MSGPVKATAHTFFNVEDVINCLEDAGCDNAREFFEALTTEPELGRSVIFALWLEPEDMKDDAFAKVRMQILRDYGNGRYFRTDP